MLSMCEPKTLQAQQAAAAAAAANLGWLAGCPFALLWFGLVWFGGRGKKLMMRARKQEDCKFGEDARSLVRNFKLSLSQLCMYKELSTMY